MHCWFFAEAHLLEAAFSSLNYMLSRSIPWFHAASETQYVRSEQALRNSPGNNGSKRLQRDMRTEKSVRNSAFSCVVSSGFYLSLMSPMFQLKFLGHGLFRSS